jgi:hypothetical protein
VNKLRMAGQRVGATVGLRPNAKAGPDLGDKLVVPAHSVALSELGSSLSPLVLTHRALDDLLVLVVIVLELTGGVYFQVPIDISLFCT